MDTLRLAVTPSTAEPQGFQVEIWVNEVEMTSAGAGLGMDPYDVLVPRNRFLPGATPTTIPVARCGCGVYGCGSTDARIARDRDTIRWEWQIETPMDRAVVFDTTQYLEEVERVASDHSWETPERTAGRLVLTDISQRELPAGLTFDWVANDWRNNEVFQVCLRNGQQHQIFLSFDWRDQSPAEMAAEVRRVLVDTAPQHWHATWSSIQRSDAAPPMASEAWERVRH